MNKQAEVEDFERKSVEDHGLSSQLERSVDEPANKNSEIKEEWRNNGVLETDEKIRSFEEEEVKIIEVLVNFSETDKEILPASTKLEVKVINIANNY